MKLDPMTPSWAQAEDARRADTCQRLRREMQEMADGHITWVLFESSGGVTQRMLGRVRHTSMISTEWPSITASSMGRVCQLDISFSTFNLNNTLDWTHADGWPRENLNETMRFAEVDDDFLAEVEMLRHHKLWEKLRQKLVAAETIIR